MFRRWANRVNLWPRLEWLAIAACILVVTGSYWYLSTDGAPLRQRSTVTSAALILINLVPLFALAALTVRRVAVLRANRDRGLAASRLHLRMMRFFALAAVIPTVLLALFAAWLFEFGFQFWFSDRVHTVISNANEISQAYVAENKKRIEGDILAMARDLNTQATILTDNANELQTYVTWQAAARNLSEAIVFSSAMDVVARTSFAVDRSSDRLLETDMERAGAGEVVVLAGSGGREDRVQALIKLDAYFDRYLYVSRTVSPQVLNQVINSERALGEYRRLTQDRKALQVRFLALIVLVSVLILIAAILAAMWSANLLTAPVGRMVRAADRIGKGDLSARVPARDIHDELGVLARALNRMAAQLQAKTHDLMDVNAQLDLRRRFSEAVLSGVSAGVLSLTRDGVITFPNRSACELLGLSASQLDGARIEDVAPAFAPLLSDATETGAAHGAATLMRGNETRNLLVRIVSEVQEGGERGFVATFDDVTEQIAFQRRAAWSDVARRIAHEIKNPLTPIQLSAERLRRKYRKEIVTEPEVFDACTETIIRQVGDLRRMVDEFSSFARMPRPAFRAEDLAEILRQSVFLQELVHTDIAFVLDMPPDLASFICDRRQIAQAVTNLLKNAAESIQARIQATPAGIVPEPGRIAISVAVDEARMRIRIADNGAGLPPELRERLTEPYVTTRARGTGLGLAIVKRIVEDHSGLLDLADSADGGAHVQLDFDLSRNRLLTSEAEFAQPRQERHGA